MEKYIALLRGINISGKNKIPMAELKACFIECGYAGVLTHLNSGNVIFSSDLCDTAALAENIKAMIAKRFALDIPVVVISQEELAEALANAPAWWDIASVEEVIHQVIFLIPPVAIEEVYKAVGEAKPQYEQVAYHKNVIFWSAPRATLSRTRWYKIASSTVNNKVTIRNATTAKKLLLLCEE